MILSKQFVSDLIQGGLKDMLKDGGFDPKKFEKSMMKAFEKKLDKELPDLAKEQAEALLKKVREGGLVTTRLVVKPSKAADEKDLGIVHKQFQNLLDVVNNDVPVLVVGLPGVGKTYAAKKVSEALNMNFHAISVGQQTTKSDILGFMDAQGKYVTTPFRKAFEKGGVFLMDEIDAGNPNVLIQINSAISNKFCEFPDKMVEAHKDFRFIGTANTYGGGINSRFVGRNQLDAATLDRFVFFDWKVDETLEEALVGNRDVCSMIREMRQITLDQELEIIISSRSAMFLQKLLEMGYKKSEAIDMSVLRGVPTDIRSQFDSIISKYENL